MNYVQVLHCQNGLALRVHDSVLNPESLQQRVAETERRRTGDDAVEVPGKALRGNHCLTPPSRAAVKVGKSRWLTVKPFGDRLPSHRHDVSRTKGEIYLCLQIVMGPLSIRGSGLVAHIGGETG